MIPGHSQHTPITLEHRASAPSTQGFDVAHVTAETSYGCSIVFYNHQDSHILTITDYYTSSHDLVLVFH